jgi:hypothetical protein
MSKAEVLKTVSKAPKTGYDAEKVKGRTHPFYRAFIRSLKRKKKA